MAIKIKNSEELFSLIGKAYWVETQLELSAQWDAYLVVKEQKHRDIIFRISHDSEAHKSIVKLIANHLEGLDLTKTVEEMKDPGYNFRKLHVEEIMAEVMRYENLAMDLYSKLHGLTTKGLIDRIWKGDEPQNFFKLTKWLISQESAHIKMVQPYAGQIQRIL
jgi:hypothetical protein